MWTNAMDKKAVLRPLAFLPFLALMGHAQQPQVEPGFRFKSGVELINVTATVSDGTGRFVPGLKQEDFAVYEDDQPVQVTHFSAERVPVSLGIALDTSGSMAGQKIQSAQDALNRFVYDLLDKQDEMFLYRFSAVPVLLQDWTSDRSLVARALSRISPNGGTAMYDTVAEAIPLAQRGQNRKKALLVISDGNDTTSHTDIRYLKQQIRESEVLVYAIGIDGESETTYRQPPPQPRWPIPIPQPFPGGGRRGRGGYGYPSGGGSSGGQGWPRASRGGDDRVNVVALRDMTDDSGGRTEIIRDARDLNPSTASIADELSKQYYLGYPSSGKKDGRWHSIRVEVRNHAYRVRARRGYTAS
jgi:VWFA-related protein